MDYSGLQGSFSQIAVVYFVLFYKCGGSGGAEGGREGWREGGNR